MWPEYADILYIFLNLLLYCFDPTFALKISVQGLITNVIF